MTLASLLAAIGCGFIGLAVGAALQRWGDADKATHGHKDYESFEEYANAAIRERDAMDDTEFSAWTYYSLPMSRSTTIGPMLPPEPYDA